MDVEILKKLLNKWKKLKVKEAKFNHKNNSKYIFSNKKKYIHIK